LNYLQTDKSQFISPLKIPLSLSANFGELRANHFHSGLDIKTQGVIGKEVVATASGYVYLILVSPVGFGRAIFIRHPSGYSTVYGHLDRYAPKIEEYVISQQYENKSYAVTIYPAKDKFRIEQGDTIGFSGNTGDSSGPHLHYEIRKSDGEKPVNPLFFHFGIEDNLKPVIEKLAIYPKSQNASINNYHKNIYFNVLGGEGKYYLSDDNEIRISGSAGFGISSYDLLDKSANKFGIYSIELLIDSISWYKYEMNEFNFYETRYINAHIDYEARIKENLNIERTFVLPNDKLSLYKGFMNDGIFDFTDNKIHNVRIVVKDVNNNQSVLSFKVKPSAGKEIVATELQDENLVVMPYGRSNKYVNEKVKVNIPPGALYDTLFFNYSRSNGNKKLFSEIHHIHDSYTPVHKAYNLSLKPDSVPKGKESKLLIVQLDENKKQSAVGGILSDGFINADVQSFGNFAVGIDTVPPVISANGLISGANLSDKNSIKIKITDDFSGIKSYTGTIDEKWALFEYDAKNDLLIYKFDSQRITKGTNHKLNLVVADNRNNFSSLTREFVW
jgi:hypothetical protein